MVQQGQMDYEHVIIAGPQCKAQDNYCNIHSETRY